MLKHISILLILFSGLYSIDKGYYIYQFLIDSDDKISLHSTKYINAKLKIPKIEKHIHDAFTYKIKDYKNNILFEGKLTNPKIIHSEDFSNETPSKNNFFLDEAYFVIRAPAFNYSNKIEFFKAHQNDQMIQQISEIKLDNNIEDTLTREIFPVTDIMVNGENESRVNIVFLGDGYTQNEMSNYIIDVEDVTSALFETVPYSNYINYFNVYAITVPSNEYSKRWINWK